MNLTTIEIPEDEAKARLAEYQTALKQERNSEDEAIAQAYRAAARGHSIIQLSKCIEAGGWFDNGLPRIAIVRADTSECFVRVGSDHVVYCDDSRFDYRGARVGRHHVFVPVTPPEHNFWNRGRTVTPLIPPRHRPKRGRIHGFHVLWEVEEWARVPSKDPALLKHIRGDLWAVLATWDLTELEMAILSVRM